MTWAEFRIRQFAYRRIEKSEWYKVREIAYNALIAPSYDPKKLPKTREKFMPLEADENSVLSDKQTEAIKNAQAQYLIDLQKAKKNGK